METLNVINHPIIQRDVSILRDKNTPNHLFRNVLSRYQGANVIKDTVMKIENRYFLAFWTADMNYTARVFDRRIIAFTTTKGTVLEFQYKLLT